MAVINYKTREMTAKIVYYGPGLSGKTTNIQVIYSKIKPENRGKLTTLATQTDRTLFFDFLPVDFGTIRGYKTKFQLYTVPGQVFYNSTRKLLLKNVDGVVFVADSSAKMIEENKESLQNLEENLLFYGIKITDIPLVIQYNKRDLPDALPIEKLEAELNPWKVPYFEAVATKGIGVLETLAAIIKMVLHKLKNTPEIISNDTLLSLENNENHMEEEAEFSEEKLKKSFELNEEGQLEYDESYKEENIEEIEDFDLDEEIEIELEDEEEEATKEVESEIDVDTEIEDIDKTLAEVESLLSEEEEAEIDLSDTSYQIVEALPTIEDKTLTIPVKLKKGEEELKIKITIRLEK